MKSKAIIFILVAFFLASCGYELPKTANTADNSAGSGNSSNQNAAKNSPGTSNANATSAVTEDTGKPGAKLVLSGVSESRKIVCNGREVELDAETTANSYTLTGECKKLTVDGVSNEVKVEKVGEIVVKGTSNKVIYGEGIGGIMVHGVAIADLGRAAVSAPIMGDDAIAILNEEQHLGIPVVGGQRPAMVEHDRLGILRTPVLEEDFDAVLGRYDGHGLSFQLHWLRCGGGMRYRADSNVRRHCIAGFR